MGVPELLLSLPSLPDTPKSMSSVREIYGSDLLGFDYGLNVDLVESR